jgi:hypothetical protein
MKKSVKIIQLIQDLDPQGFYDLWGLGDDGVVYKAIFEDQLRKWEVLFPLPNETVTETE